MKQFILFIGIFTAFHIALFAQTDSLPTIDLLFVGDIMGHGPQIRSAEIVKDKVYDYDPCFKYVKSIIQEADLAIGNLEVTLPGKAPYQGYPQFRSPDDLATALYHAGFDLLVTANNHSNDARKEGVLNTIATLEANGFYQTGTFRNQAERDLYYPLLVYKNGFKLAFLNYTYDTNKIPTTPPTIVNEIDEDLIEKDMKLAKDLNPDAIIVLMHWGSEYHLEESKKQQRLADKIFRWGADLIVGAHPHVIQPIKEYTYPTSDTTSRAVVIPYSLGNFISNQKKPNTDGGLIFEVTLRKKKEGGIEIQDHHYIPVWRYIHRPKKGKRTYYCLPISVFEQDNSILELPEEDRDKMNDFAKRMRKHLNKYKGIERKVSLQ